MSDLRVLDHVIHVQQVALGGALRDIRAHTSFAALHASLAAPAALAVGAS